MPSRELGSPPPHLVAAALTALARLGLHACGLEDLVGGGHARRSGPGEEVLAHLLAGGARRAS